jgi:hypothetical protein
MHSGMACRAQRDQVLLGVGSRMTAELPVVHLQTRRRATGLTPPAVATQGLLAQTFVRQGIQPRGSGFGANRGLFHGVSITTIVRQSVHGPLCASHAAGSRGLNFAGPQLCSELCSIGADSAALGPQYRCRPLDLSMA